MCTVTVLGSMSLVRQQSTIVSQIGDIVGTLPDAIQQNIQGDSPTARASYAFAVYLLAPIAIVVPLTISSAVGANSIVGERERGTGELHKSRLCAGGPQCAQQKVYMR